GGRLGNGEGRGVRSGTRDHAGPPSPRRAVRPRRNPPTALQRGATPKRHKPQMRRPRAPTPSGKACAAARTCPPVQLSAVTLRAEGVNLVAGVTRLLVGHLSSPGRPSTLRSRDGGRPARR